MFDAAGYKFGTQNFLAARRQPRVRGRGAVQAVAGTVRLPRQRPAGRREVEALLDGTVYYTDYQGVRFISLNSNITDARPLAVQTAWLEETLETNPNKWTVVYFHHPVFSLDEGRNNRAIREAWLPMFETYNVDLVLQGHDHSYGRGNTDAAEEGTAVDWNPGPVLRRAVYAISTSARSSTRCRPPGVERERRPPEEAGWAVHSSSTRSCTSSRDTLRYEARTADGHYFDGVTIVKNEARQGRHRRHGARRHRPGEPRSVPRL